MADQPISRRMFLRQAPLVGVGAAAALALPAAALAMPVAPVIADTADPIFKRYLAFLAHEHRAALCSLYADMIERNPGAERTVPMFWFPDDPDVQTLIAKRPNSEARARNVLHAVGLPIPPQSWF